MTEVDELYQELIIEHYKHPHHRGPLVPNTCSCTLFNPLCGDQVQLHVLLSQGTEPQKIEQINFEGQGCAISQATASILTELCQGREVEEVKQISLKFQKMLQGTELNQKEQEALGDAVALQGVSRFPMRVKCTMLAWEVLEKCLGGGKSG